MNGEEPTPRPHEPDYPRRIYWLAIFLTVMVVGGAIFLTRSTFDSAQRESQRAQELAIANRTLLRQLGAYQIASQQAGFISREQIRCNQFESQNALLRLILLNKSLTKEQVDALTRIIKLPSIRVENGDGTTTAMDCDRIIAQPVPGLPKGIPNP